MAIGLTEPPAVGLDAGVGELFRLEVVPEHLPGAVPLGPRLVHLEPPHGGRGPAPAAGAAARALLVIGAVDVVRVPRLARHVHRLLLLLRHLPLPRLLGSLLSSRWRGEGEESKEAVGERRQRCWQARVLRGDGRERRWRERRDSHVRFRHVSSLWAGLCRM